MAIEHISLTGQAVWDAQSKINSNFTQIDQAIQNLDAAKALCNTSEYWATQISFVPAYGQVVIYSNYDQIVENNQTKYIPGIKIGDGNAYVVDLPFIDSKLRDQLLGHIDDSTIHVTSEEKTFWNNKLNLTLDGENLQFNRD